MIDNIRCYFRRIRYLRTTGSRSKPTVERMAFLGCYRQRTDCGIVREFGILRCTSSAIRCGIPCYFVLTLRLIELSGISGFTLYINNRRRPCVIKRKVLGICRCLSRSITAIFRSISVCYLIRLQGRTVAIYPSDGIFAGRLIIHCRINSILCYLN